ncbi:MAG: DUF2141 domain-containing protein [Cocleimonas sp.]|nr:DUF2141 domain-containing protein [Cocleimonas sp.]
MKFFLTMLWGIFFMASTNSAVAEKLQVAVTGIDVTKGGNIAVYIFTHPKGFPKVHKEALLKQVKKASAPNLQFQFTIPKESNALAIKLHHDINGDGLVTKNWTGIIPKDGLGFSNKQRLSFAGVPSFAHSKISKSQFMKTQKVVIRYYSR